MAPTLNSTLIHSEDSHENGGTTTCSPMEETEKELSQYSPILARPSRRAPSSPHPGRARHATKPTLFTSATALDYSTGTGTLNSPGPSEEINEIPIWICGEPRFVSGITSQTTCANIIEALIQDELQTLDEGQRKEAVLSDDLRDYTITERWRDVEQPLPGDTFILPLWKAWGTKCATNEVKFKLRLNRWASSSHLAVAVAGDQARDSKAEEPRKQERPTKKPEERTRKVDRMTMIDKMMRKILKQGETIKHHLSQLTDNQAEMQRLETLCEKIRQTKQGKKILMENFIRSTKQLSRNEIDFDPLAEPGVLTSALTSEDELFYMDPPILTDTEAEQTKKRVPAKAKMEETEDDELFLVIEQDNDDLDSGVHFDLNKRSKSQMTEMQPICSSVELTEVLLETPKRKKRVQRNFEELKRHSLNKRFERSPGTQDKETPVVPAENPDFKRTSLQFDTIRREIIVKMNDLKDLLQKEENLILNLEAKCQRYRRENEIYGRKERGQVVQLKVDEIQENLNRYAKEIVQHELDLYKTKLEIRENYLVLDDLKEMLADKDPISGFGKSEFNRLVEKKFGLTPSQGQGTPATTTLPSFVTSPFVDNVHEFCDNNQDSIIV